MTKREKAGLVLVITGFLLVLLGCCLVADNPYWWVSIVISGTGCALIALAVFVLPKVSFLIGCSFSFESAQIGRAHV